MSEPAPQAQSQPQTCPMPDLSAQQAQTPDIPIQEVQTQEIQSQEEKAEESRRIRRLQLMMNMVIQVIQQDASLPVEQASEMCADARKAALAMFPDKALAFNLIFWPRLQRLMHERYRMQ